MTISKQDLLDDLQKFEDADQAHAEARTATDAAKANTSSVIAVEQALVDQANAHKAQAVTEAQAEEDSAVAAEQSAEASETEAKDKLVADLEAFAGQQ